MDIKQFVFIGNRVQFDSFRAGYFYYNIENKEGVTHQFQIPVEDIGNATLLATDKAITFMRWIRKAIEGNTLIKLHHITPFPK